MFKFKDIIRMPKKIIAKQPLGMVVLAEATPNSLYNNLIYARVLVEGKGPADFYFSSHHGMPELVNEKPQFDLNQFWKLIPLSMGSDPEVFVGKEGKIIPAWKFLPCKALVDGALETPYWDGFQAEFNTKNQVCCEYLTDSFRRGLLALRQHGDIILDSTIGVPRSTLSKAAAAHVELGCNPSQNAYNAIGLSVINGRELDVRFAGMHMHFGFGKQAFDAVKIVKALDKVLGLAITAIGNGRDNPIRRMYYGLAGEYRLPKHGLEYRVPGSWLMTHPALIHLSFDLARWAIYLELFDQLDSNWEADEAEVQQIINQGDFVGARVVLARSRNVETLTAFTEKVYGDYGKLETTKNTFWNVLNGIVQFDPKKFDQYWRVGGEWAELSRSPNCNFSSFAVNGGPA